MNDGAARDLTASLDLQTDLWWLAIFFTGLMGTLFAAVAFTGAGAFWLWLIILVRVAIVLCLAQQPWGKVFEKLFDLGLAAGVFAIFADYLLTTWDAAGGQRIYSADSRVLLRSPLYLPLLWAIVVVEFGYPILRIYGLVSKKVPGETGLGATMVAGGLLAMIVTLATDSMAVIAGWWRYAEPYSSVGGAGAVYIVVGNFFAFFTFPAVFVRFAACPSGRLYAAIRYGIILAGALFASYAIGHLLVEQSL